MSEGRIVSVQNQVEARIWFFNSNDYKNAIDLDDSYHNKNGRFEGVVLNIQGNHFAVKYNYEDSSEVLIREKNALTIPFFESLKEKRIPSSLHTRINGKMVQQFNYRLEDIITHIDDAFADWVESKIEKVRVTDEEKENGDYPEEWDWRFTSESADKFVKMQELLELKFAQSTGFYYHFMGGTIED
jgi:hypothetical protein